MNRNFCAQNSILLRIFCRWSFITFVESITEIFACNKIQTFGITAKLFVVMSCKAPYAFRPDILIERFKFRKTQIPCITNKYLLLKHKK